MFLKSLTISNIHREIRHIKFHAGLNLIVDETPTGAQETGNNVGKTTVLMLIDFCLGAEGKAIYTDPENKKAEYLLVKNFLISTEVLITLNLVERLDGISDADLLIERNFLARNKAIRRINGVQHTEEGFERTLTNNLFAGHYGKKPTFSQIISHNIRYKEISILNTLRNLNAYTRDDEYETLYLFLFGCDFDQGNTKQNLLAQLRVETSFKSRLESNQTRSAYEASLALLLLEIADLNKKRQIFKENTTFEANLHTLGELKYQISVTSAELSRSKLRESLINEAVRDVLANASDVDLVQLNSLYADVSGRLAGITKSFDDLVIFHNKMVKEKVRYLAKELPELQALIDRTEVELRLLLRDQSDLAMKVSESGTLNDLEAIVGLLSDRHRLRGEYETVLAQISRVDDSIDVLKSQLSIIDRKIFSGPFETSIKAQLNKLNHHFSTVSQLLYNEQYAVKVDRVKTRTGQQVYKFNSFNTNMSSGKKQGEITCFDIAYTLFADEEGIPCYHFLLNDKKELMHDNQLSRIGRLVERQQDHIQFVASILRDKLPLDLDNEQFIILKLSQQDKLFRIESAF